MKYFFLVTLPLLTLTGCTSVEVKPTTISSCTYEEFAYRIGEIFPASDGVNTCECRSGGTVECTNEPVPKNPAQCEVAADCEALDLETFCQDGSWSCIENTCEFSCNVNGML